jgi:hypothetical protein
MEIDLSLVGRLSRRDWQWSSLRYSPPYGYHVELFHKLKVARQLWRSVTIRIELRLHDALFGAAT